MADVPSQPDVSTTPPQDNNVGTALGEDTQTASPAPEQPSEAPPPTPAPAPAPPAASTNPYAVPTDDSIANIVKQQIQEKQQNAEAVNASATYTDPEKQARALELGKQFGLPAATISQNLPEFEQRATLMKNNDILRNNPQLTSWVVNNPEQAVAAKDDYEHLDTIGKVVDQIADIGRAGQQLVVQAAGGVVRGFEQMEDPYDREGKLVEPTHYGENLTTLAEPIGPRHTIGKLSQGAMYFAGGAVPGALAMGANQFNTQDVSLLNQGVDPSTAAVTSVLGGALTTGTAFVPTGKFIVGEGLAPLVKSAVSSTAKAGVVGGAQSLAGDIATSQILKGQGYDEAAKENAPSVERTLEGAATMAGFHLGGAAYHGIGEAKGIANEKATLDENGLQTYDLLKGQDFSHQDAFNIAKTLQASTAGDLQTLKLFNSLADLSGQSKTRDRSPDSFQSYMQSVIPDGSPAQHVYLPADKVAELYKAKGVEPGENDGLLGKAAPDIAKQMEQALPRGGDVVISTADYLTHVADTETDKALRPDIRLGADGNSANDIQETNQRAAEILKTLGKDLDTQKIKDDSTRQIFEDMQQKAKASGQYNDREGAQVAAVVASRYTARGERTGRDPFELYQSENTHIVGPKTPADVLANIKTPDVIMNEAKDIKNRMSQPKFDRNNIYEVKKAIGTKKAPQSLITWMASKGLSQDAANRLPGELKGIFGKSKAGILRRLIKKSGGYGLDELAAQAREAGYFHGQGAEHQGANRGEDQLTSDDLLHLVEQEVHGDRIYPENVQKALDEKFGPQGAHEDLDKLLDRYQIEDSDDVRGIADKIQKHYETQGYDDSEPNAQEHGDEDMPSFLQGDKPVDVNANKEDNNNLTKGEKNGRLNNVRTSGATGTVHPARTRFVDSETGSTEGARIFSTAESAREAIRSGELNQKSDKATLCFETAGKIAQDQGTDMVIGTIDDGRGDRIYHAVNYINENGQTYIYDATLGKAFTPDVYNIVSKGWRPVKELTSAEVREHGQRFSKWPGPDELSLPKASKIGADYKPERGGEQYDQDARARVTMHQGKRIIELFEKGDKTSVLHEMMHIWRDEMEADAARPEASDQVKNDWAAIQAHDVKYADKAQAEIEAKTQDLKNQLANEPDEARKENLQRQIDAHERVLDRLTRDPGLLTAVAKGAKLVDPAEHQAAITPFHENFARSGEAYLMEGKAPSNALRAAFNSFKNWFKKVYGTVRNLNVDIPDDMRRVFDRMLATDDEIKQQENSQKVNRLFKTPQEAGMTDAEFKAYNKAAMNIEQTARDELFNQVLDGIKKQHTREWNAADKKIRPAIEKAVDAEKDMQALKYFKDGKLSNDSDVPMPKMQINRADLNEMYPNQNIEAQLPKDVRSQVSDDGAHPDEIAPFLGYKDGKDLINDMRQLGQLEQSKANRQGIRNYVVDQTVNNQLHNHFGVSDAEMRERAEELVGSADRLDMKMAEIKALARKTGQLVGFTKENVQSWAEDNLNQMNVKDASNVRQFMRSVSRLGNEAQEAVAKGDDAKAYDALQKQALNIAMADHAREIAKARDQAKKLFNYLGRNKTIGSISQDFLDQIHGLLQRLGAGVNRGSSDLGGALKDKSFLDFVADKSGKNLNPESDIKYANFLNDPNFKGVLDSLTTQQFTDFTNTIKSLRQLGIDEKQVTVEGQRVAKDAILNEIKDNLAGRPQRKASDYYNPSDESALVKMKNAVVDTLRSIGSGLTKAETYFNWADLRDKSGPMNLLHENIQLAKYRIGDAKKTIQAQREAFADTLTPKEAKDFNKKTFIDNENLIHPATGEPMKITRSQMRQIMRNMGNESNFKKLADGWGWKPEDIKAVVDANASKSDWDYVQNELNIHKQFWPELEALERRTHGYAPENIKATPVDTPFGRYDGGYYPIIYDLKNSKEVRLELKNGPDYSRPTTVSAASKDRAKTYSDRISLHEDAGINALSRTVHDINMREPVQNMAKIIYDKGFKDEFTKTFGDSAYSSLNKWLQDTASQGAYDKDFNRLSAFLNKSISNFAGAQIGFNVLSTLPKHTASAAVNVPAYVGPAHALSAFGDIVRNPGEAYRWADSKFAELGLRRHNIDQTFQEVNKQIGEGTLAKVDRNFINYSHAAINEADYFTSVWVSTAAYKKAIGDGATEEEAVRLANKAVRETHGTADIMGRSWIERQNWAKPFTMFYGFANRSFNNIMDTYDQAKLLAHDYQGGKIEGADARREAASVIGRSIAYTMMVGAIEQGVAGLVSGQKDKKSPLKEIASDIGSQVAMSIPGVRDAYRYAEGKSKGLDFTPLGEMGQTIVATSKHIVQGKPEPEEIAKSAGYLTGRPIVQPYHYGKYTWNYMMGDEDPQSFGDYYHGMASGGKH